MSAGFTPFNLELQRGLRRRGQTDALWKVMAWACAQVGLRVQVVRGQVPATGPLLVVVNDPSPLIAFISLSTVPREDLHYIGNPGWKKMGGSVGDRCLPVYTVGDFRNYPKEFLRAHIIYRFRDGVTPSTAGRKNIESLRGAAEVLNAGGSLVVAPAGGTMGKSDNWKHGVGHILSKIRAPGAQLQLMRVDGTTPPDVSRMFFNPGWFPKLRRPLDIRVALDDPRPIADFVQPGLPARDASLRLREAYVQRFGSL